MKTLYRILATCFMVGIGVILSCAHINILTWQWWAIILLVACYGIFQIASFDNDNDD